MVISVEEQEKKKEKKKIFLTYIGSLVFYCVFGIVLIKLFQVMFGMNVENIWLEGLQIGLISWLFVMVLPLFIKPKKK